MMGKLISHNIEKEENKLKKGEKINFKRQKLTRNKEKEERFHRKIGKRPKDEKNQQEKFTDARTNNLSSSRKEKSSKTT